MPLPVNAFDIGAGFHGAAAALSHVRRIMVPDVHVGHGAAVADNIAIKLPSLAQMVAQQHGAGAGRSAIDRVVGAHHRLGVRLSHRSAKGGQISVLKIVRRDIHVKAVPQQLRAAVHGIVLRS